jgi:hypothetical protein
MRELDRTISVFVVYLNVLLKGMRGGSARVREEEERDL